MFNATSMGLKLSFGKHKGRTIADVIKSDAQYILWLKHSNIMSFADHILTEAEAKNKPRTYSYRSGYSYSRYTKKKRKEEIK